MSFRRACALLVASLLLAAPAATLGAPPRAPAPTRSPPKPLPAPPTLPLIRVEVAHDHVLVTEDVLLRRGEWVAGDLDAFVGFGAPGLPRAIDARLYAETSDSDDLSPGVTFDSVSIDRAFQRPANARLLLGSSTMAGAVLHLREALFRRATEASGIVRLRIRTLLDLPAPDVRTGREVVVRLGTYGGEPDALGAIEIATDEPKPWVTRAEAHLCGASADPYPLAVRVRGEPAAPVRSRHALEPSPVAPVLSVRHPSDDLCIRFWTSSDP